MSKELTAMFLKLVHKQREEMVPSSFYEASIIVVQIQIMTQQKNSYMPISLVNIDINFLNKMLVDGVQQHI